jgi:hypothetical protein
MGICYYLKRADNRTFYELGKHTADWEAPLKTIDRPTEQIVRELRDACDEDGWGLDGDTYLIEVVEDIKRWADGKPFTWADDCGDALDEWQDDPSWDFDAAITGTRYRT